MARGESQNYRRFAQYYDFIYHDIVNYAGDVAFLESAFRRWMDRKPHRILDLGCGTGNHDLPLARRGHDVTGLDLSASQLALAREKARRAGLAIRFVRGDMRSFDLSQDFDAAVCMFGAFGYLLEPADVVRCLRSLRRHLKADGLFVFEFWQSSAAKPAGLQDWIHKRGRDFELLRLSEARYDPRTRVLPIEFRFFVFRGRTVIDRFVETHVVRTYRPAQMRALLRRGGFESCAMYAATTGRKGFEPVRPDSFRVMAIARPHRTRSA